VVRQRPLAASVYLIRRLKRKEESMTKLGTNKRTLIADESGQALAEYSLLLTFIAAVCLLAVTALGLAIAGGFGSILPAF
jgi:Flp pilus assembly pilin Flp